MRNAPPLYGSRTVPEGYCDMDYPDGVGAATQEEILAQPCVVVLKQLLAEALVELREHDCEAEHYTRGALRKRIAVALGVPDPVTNDPRERA